ncbi:MAG: S41 family peptidase [Meiothermus sp.]|nr:S41 family peptidase [Meiothermus sp.]
MRGLWIGLLIVSSLGLAQTPAAPSPYAVRFEQAWKLVKERYYLTDFNGADWEALGTQYRAKLGQVKSWNQLYALLGDLYDELKDDHSTVLSPELARRYLGGGQCQALPFRDSDLFPQGAPSAPNPQSQTPETQNPQAQTQPPAQSQPPQTTPPQPRPDASPSVSAYAQPTVRFTDGVVVVRVSNLVDVLGLNALRDAIRQYDSRARGYVLDIRGNPGGLALRMAEVTGLFMVAVPWRLVVRGLGGVPFSTTPIPPFGRPLTSKPLALLIDGGVNSAAEGLAGALKESKRAYVIGTRTAGNVEALTPYCFPDGGVALVANGVLAPFRGATWEGRGVEPDLVIEDRNQQLEEAIRYIRNLRR